MGYILIVYGNQRHHGKGSFRLLKEACNFIIVSTIAYHTDTTYRIVNHRDLKVNA
jgi:hypothetical protein